MTFYGCVENAIVGGAVATSILWLLRQTPLIRGVLRRNRTAAVPSSGCGTCGSRGACAVRNVTGSREVVRTGFDEGPSSANRRSFR